MLLLCIMIGHWKVQKCRFPFKLGQQKTVSFLWVHFPHLQTARLPKRLDFLKFHLLLAAVQLPASKLYKSRLLPAQPSPNGPQHSIHHRPSPWTSTAIAIKLAGSSVALERLKLQIGCLLFFLRFPKNTPFLEKQIIEPLFMIDSENFKK